MKNFEKDNGAIWRIQVRGVARGEAENGLSLKKCKTR